MHHYQALPLPERSPLHQHSSLPYICPEVEQGTVKHAWSPPSGCVRGVQGSSWTIDVKVLSCMQVKYAFLAGLAVVLLLVPINRWLALKIERASENMMAYKDVRCNSAMLCLGMCSM